VVCEHCEWTHASQHGTTAGNQSVPVSDPVQKAMEATPKEEMKFFGEQKNRALDSFKPYQRPNIGAQRPGTRVAPTANHAAMPG